MSEARPWHGVEHSENFPVASWLVPAHLRPAVIAIYHFARHADDLADEGDADVAERDRALRALDEALTTAARGRPSQVVVVDALVGPVARHGLHWSLFHDLIDAFRQDLRVRRYESEAMLLDYCRRSANPVGRLLLQLFGADSARNLVDADAICSALQRINFLQDIAIDAAKDRVYLPAETLAAAGVDAQTVLREAQLGRLGPGCREAVQREWERCRQQLLSGAGLCRRVPWRLGAELRFIISGGHRILDRIAAGDYDSVAHRPQLGWRDGPALFHRAVWLPSPR